MAEGKSEAYNKLTVLLDRVGDGLLPTDFGEDTSKDLEELLELTSNDHRYKFNIPILHKFVYGIGNAEFGVFFAPPETGKTAFAVSLACGPNGFCQQGHTVLYLGNEEKTSRTMLRAYQSFTGMRYDEIVNMPKLALERFELIADNIIMKDINGWDINRVEAFIDFKKPNIVLIDQGDKVSLEGSYDAPHLRLRELYTQFRELAKRADVALMVASQASDAARGHTIVTPDMMEGSKVGKFAEADLIIGIGKHADASDGTVDPVRYLTIGKNKLSGWHGTLACKLSADISRYED